MNSVATPRVRRVTGWPRGPAWSLPRRLRAEDRRAPVAGESGEVEAAGPSGSRLGRPPRGWRRWRSGVAAAAADPSPEGIVCSPNRFRRRPIDHLIPLEDIAMTSAVLILALSGVGFGHHGDT